MRLIIFLLFSIVGYSQNEMNKITILNNKVEILVSKRLSKMSDEMFAFKYGNRPKPSLVLSDGDAEVNLIVDMTKQTANEDRLTELKDFQLSSMKKNRPDIEVLDEGIKVINGKKVGYFKFISNAIDQKVFNYYFFTVIDGKVLFCSFNCIERLRKDWEETADQMVTSLKIL